jgi:hypothetical protein
MLSLTSHLGRDVVRGGWGISWPAVRDHRKGFLFDDAGLARRLGKRPMDSCLELVFVSPWLLLYAPYYLIAVTHPLGLPLTQVPEVRVAIHPTALFSPDTTFLGSSRLAYTCLVLGLFLCILYVIMNSRGESSSRKSCVALASASAAAGGNYLFWVLMAPHLDESTSMFRYSIPVLIGVSSAAMRDDFRAPGDNCLYHSWCTCCAALRLVDTRARGEVAASGNSTCLSAYLVWRGH